MPVFWRLAQEVYHEFAVTYVTSGGKAAERFSGNAQVGGNECFGDSLK